MALTLNQSLLQYQPLVKKIAWLLARTLPPNVEVDDLVQVGMMGLVESLERFDPEQGVKFESFAGRRIKGSMIDELRRQDWLTRSDRKEFGADFSMVSLDVNDFEDEEKVLPSELIGHETGEQVFAHNQRIQHFFDAIQNLPEKERLVMNGLYDEEVDALELSTRLGVTTSRVSQIHTGALRMLRERMAVKGH